MISFIYLLSSLMNYPLLTIGDNAIGVFDFVFIIMFLTLWLFKRKAHINDFTFFYLIVFMIIILTSLRYAATFDLPSIAYGLKFLQLALIPLTISHFANISIETREKIIFTLLLVSFAYINYDHATSFTRARAPFLYNGSGPLGLITAIYFFIGYYNTNAIFRNLLIIMGLQLLLISFSKSFILSMSIVLSIMLIKNYRHMISSQNILYTIVLISMFTALVFELDYVRKFIFLYETVINLREQTSFVERIKYHWFVNWEEHLMSLDVVFGHGITNIPFSYDSLYFFSLYVFGVLGSFFLTIALIILWIKGSLIFRYYTIILLISGIFLETALISYRGVEPLILILSFFSVRNPALIRKIAYGKHE